MSSRNITIAVIGILVVIVAGWFVMQPKQATTPAPAVPAVTSEPSPSQSAVPSASEGATLQENIVEIASSGFSPQNITLKKGGSVTWINSDSENHIVNSAPHPTHTTYPPLNLGLIKPGDKKSLIFPDSGTYKYHNHLNPSLFGSVTVQ